MRRLLIRPGAIGDCILSLPALEFLKAEYTEVWAPADVLPVIRFADRVRSIASTGLDLLELPDTDASRVVDALQGFDSIVSWYGANRKEFRSRAPFQFFCALPDENTHLHAADFFMEQVGGPLPAIPRIPVPARERENFAVIHPYSGSPRKNWPLDRYRELASRLPIPVRWCNGPGDPFADLYELACWLASARLFIGNDSGIAHLAAAVGTPVVAIFGPTNPAVWAPRAAHRRIVQGDLPHLGTEAVLAAALDLLFIRRIGEPSP